ncbi:MAG: RluA family pseudouridine synthase, partial [Oscillospiraceae bacterium]
VHPSHLHQGDTLGNAFASHCSGISFRPINRLDKDTSGLCVVAKNAYSAKILQSSLEKVYYAIASGEILDSGRIDLPISRTSDSIISREVSENGQRAVTNFEIITRTDKYFLAKIFLETGRTHQIRVHFAHIGCPLAGDDMYGGDCSDITEQALHCGEVKFLQPISGKEIQLKAPIRADMKSLIEKNSSAKPQ